MSGKTYSARCCCSLFLVLGMLLSATSDVGAYDPLLQNISVTSMSGSGTILLHYAYPLASVTAATIMIREKNMNNSATAPAPNSPGLVTGDLGKEYEIAVTRVPESGESNQEFLISTVVLIGNDSLSIPLGEVTSTSFAVTRRIGDTTAFDNPADGTVTWGISGFKVIGLSPSTEYSARFRNKDCLLSCTEIQVYATTLPASVVNANVSDRQADNVTLMCNWELEPGSPQPLMYSIDWFRDSMQMYTLLISAGSETSLSATYILGIGASCVGSYHAVVAGVDRFGRKGGNVSTDAITISTTALTAGFQGISAVAVSTSEIKLSWILGGPCTETAANISIMYTDACQIVTLVDPSSSEYRMTGLRPSTTYSFTVSALNEFGAVHGTVQAVTLEQPCVCANTGAYVGGIVALSVFIVLSNVLTAVLTGCCVYRWCASRKRDTHYVQQVQHHVFDSGRDVNSASSGYDEIQTIQRSIGAQVTVQPNPAYRPSRSNLLIDHEYMTPKSNPYAVPRPVEDKSKETAETSP